MAGSIYLEADGFALTPPLGPAARARWDHVDEIACYKRDVFAYDLICLAFHTPDGWIECSEDEIVFTRLAEAVEARFDEIDADWYREVALPPFETKFRTLWKRSAR